MFWVALPIGIGVGTGIGVGIRGGSLPEVVAWSAVTSGLSYAAGSARFWSGAWSLSNWLRIGAPLTGGGRAILSVGGGAGGIGVGAAVGATVAGYVVGAAAGTVVVSEAEKKGIVYEGATEDVLDLYLPGGAGGTEYVEAVVPALIQQTGTLVERQAEMTPRERLEESIVAAVLGPIIGAAYIFFKW